jgi:hypothetical protein
MQKLLKRKNIYTNTKVIKHAKLIQAWADQNCFWIWGLTK